MTVPLRNECEVVTSGWMHNREMKVRWWGVATPLGYECEVVASGYTIGK